MSTDIFDIYEEGRGLTRGAAKNIIEEIFLKFIPRDKPVLEIGSGIGELSQLVPAGYKIIETDKNKDYLAYSPRKRPPERVAVDIEHLPFNSNSFQTVAGYSALDTLSNLPAAFQEISRVLKENGRIIHFLDMSPDAAIIMEDFGKNFILFPYTTHNEPPSFQVISKKDFENAASLIPSTTKVLIDFYIKDPLEAFGILIQNNRMEDLSKISNTIQNLPVEKKVIKPMDYFKKKIETVLVQQGFKIEQSEYVTRNAVTRRNKNQYSYHRANLFKNGLGFVQPSFDSSLSPHLKPNEVMEESTLFVLVAKKQI